MKVLSKINGPSMQRLLKEHDFNINPLSLIRNPSGQAPSSSKECHLTSIKSTSRCSYSNPWSLKNVNFNITTSKALFVSKKNAIAKRN